MKDMIIEMIKNIADMYLTDERMDEVKTLLIDWLREQAQKSDNTLDDYAVDKFAEFLEVDA